MTVAMAERWNHNIHYNRLLVGALPEHCGRVLDVGCGEGMLTWAMRASAERITGIDPDLPAIESARRHAAGDNIDYVVGDLLAAPFAPDSFDAVVANTVIHQIGTAEALERMKELARPGGVVAVVGIGTSRTPVDGAYDLTGAVVTRLHRRSKGWYETCAPKTWPPPESFGGVRRIARRVLPGARFRRHVLWRYSLVWIKP